MSVRFMLAFVRVLFGFADLSQLSMFGFVIRNLKQMKHPEHPRFRDNERKDG